MSQIKNGLVKMYGHQFGSQIQHKFMQTSVPKFK